MNIKKILAKASASFKPNLYDKAALGQKGHVPIYTIGFPFNTISDPWKHYQRPLITLSFL